MKPEHMNIDLRKLHYWLFGIGIALGTIANAGLAQGQGGLTLPDLMRLRPEIGKETQQIPVKMVATDGPVNPSEYFVGPNDVLALNIWSAAPVSHQLTVTPEGLLLIPNVGAVDLKNMTLEAAKDKVASMAGKRYPNAEITLSLVTPRRVIVHVMGNVLNETMFEMSSVERVDNLIVVANVPVGTYTSREFYDVELPRIRHTTSRRNILLKRKNGTNQRVDLVKYELTGEGKFNPYLREGDVVIIPHQDDLMAAIGIYGGVRRFGAFEYVPGDSLTDLISMGFGFQAGADSENVVLTRLSSDGRNMERLTVNPVAIRAGRAPNMALKPGDRVVVPLSREPRQNYRVEIEGEVVRPGQYPITRDNTRLSEVIADAGGLTKDANIRGGRVVRARLSPWDPPKEIQRERLLSTRTSFAVQDSAYYLTETALRIDGEEVAVDFYQLFVEGDSTQDITLRAYDRIIVPAKRRTVYVFGQVRSPGHFAFVEGKGHSYYINEAHGFTNDARSGDVKIIKGHTRAWLDPGETTLEDGDLIWVPKEPYYPFSHYVTMYAQIAGIIGAVATVALLINTIK